MATTEHHEPNDGTAGRTAGKHFVVLACYKEGIDPGDNYRTFVERCAPQLTRDLAQLQKISREFLSDGNRRKRVALARDSDEDSGSDLGEPADGKSLYEKLPPPPPATTTATKTANTPASTPAAAAPPVQTRHRRRRTEEKTQILVEEDPFGAMDKFNDRENKRRTTLRKLLDHTSSDYQEKQSQLKVQSRYHWYIASVIGPWEWKWAAERFSTMLSRRSRSLLPRVSQADIMACLEEIPAGQFVAAPAICGRKVTADGLFPETDC